MPGVNDVAFIPSGGAGVAIAGVVHVAGLQLGEGSSLAVAQGGTLNLHGDTILNGRLTKAGRLNWIAGRLRVTNTTGDPLAVLPATGEIDNNAQAIFDIQCDGTMESGYGQEPFVNSGSLIKSAGNGTATLGLQFSGNGVMDAQQGTVALSGGGGVSGHYQAEAGAAIHFSGGSFTLGANPDFHAGDEVWFTGGEVTITATLANLTLRGSDLAGGLQFITGTCVMQGGKLLGDESLAGLLEWHQGTVDSGCSLTVLSGGTLRIYEGLGVFGLLTNAGNIEWQSGGITLFHNAGSLGSIINQSGGVFDANSTDNSWITGYWGGEDFSNAGTLRKPIGANPLSVNVWLHGPGSIHAIQGSIALQKGCDLAGHYLADPDAAINFSGGTFTLAQQPNFVGAVKFTGGLVEVIAVLDHLALDGAELTSGLSFISGTFTLNSGSISHTQVLNAECYWYGGTLGVGADLTLTPGHQLHVRGGMSLYGPLHNLSTMVVESGTITLLDNTTSILGSIWNAAGALLDFQCDTWVGGYWGNERLHNAGILRKSQGSGSLSIGVYLNGDGLLEAKQGTIYLNSGGGLSAASNYQADLNAAIFFNGGNFLLDHQLEFPGQGRVWFTGGTVTLTGAMNQFDLHGSELLGGLGNVTQNFMLYSGSISGNETLNANLTWHDGTLNPGATLTITADHSLFVENSMSVCGSLLNYGTLYWEAGNILVLNNHANLTGSIVNEPGAFFDVHCDGWMSGYWGDEQLHNQGTLRKMEGVGTSSINLYLTGDGALEAWIGRIYLNSGCDLAGTYAASGSAAVYFNGGAFNIDHQPAFNDRDHVWFTGGTVTISGPLADLDLHGSELEGGLVWVSHSFNLYGGGIRGNETLAAEGNWYDGSLLAGASLTVSAGQTLNLLGGMSLYGPLINAGTIDWQAGNLMIINNNGGNVGSLTNQAGAFFDIHCDQWVAGYWGQEEITNEGTLRKSGSNGTTAVGVRLIGLGSVDVQQGLVNCGNGCSLQGTYQAEAGAALHFTGGNYTVNHQPDFQGEVWFTGGQVEVVAAIQHLELHGSTLTGGLDQVLDHFHLYAGNFSGAQTLSPGATLDWQDGTLNGGCSLSVAAGATLNGFGSMALDGVLTNLGTLNWLGGNIFVANNNANYSGAIWNQAGALIDIRCDQWMGGYWGTEVLHNAGTLRKSAGIATTNCGLNVVGSGTAEALLGTLRFTSQYTGGISVGLAGTVAGSGFGNVRFEQSPLLTANLTVKLLQGFQPAVGDEFRVLNYPSATVNFGALIGLNLTGGLLLDPQYDATGLTLVTVADLPALSITQVPAGVLLSWPVKYTGWKLEASTDLAQWQTIAVGANNSITEPLLEPERFFRLAKTSP